MQDKLLTGFKIVVIVLFLIALVVGGWAAITYFTQGGGSGGTSGEVKIVWWGLWERKDNVQPLIDKYTAQHPNVTIEYVEKIKTEYKDVLKDKLTDGDPSTSPDIIRMHNTWTTEFEPYLSSLPSDVMTKSDYATIFYDTYTEDLTGKDGNIKAIPLMYDGLGLYYNKDLLEDKGYSAPPSNWRELEDMAQILTRRDENGDIIYAGAALGASDNIEFSFDILSLLMLQQMKPEGQMVDSSGSNSAFGDDEDAARALDYYMKYTYQFNTWDPSLPLDVTWFTEGRLAFYFAPSWRALNIMSANPDLDFAIAPVPQLQPDDPVSWSDYWAEAVTADSRHQEVAWDFLKFMSEQEQLQEFYNICKQEALDEGAGVYRPFGEIYPRTDMVLAELEEDPYVGAYLEMAPISETWKMVDKQKVSEIFNDVIKSLEGSEASTSIAGNKLEDASQLVDQILAT